MELLEQYQFEGLTMTVLGLTLEGPLRSKVMGLKERIDVAAKFVTLSWQLAKVQYSCYLCLMSPNLGYNLAPSNFEIGSNVLEK